MLANRAWGLHLIPELVVLPHCTLLPSVAPLQRLLETGESSGDREAEAFRRNTSELPEAGASVVLPQPPIRAIRVAPAPASCTRMRLRFGFTGICFSCTGTMGS